MGLGFKARQEEQCVYLVLDSEALYDAVRDTVADLGLPLVRVQQERRRLEDIFREPDQVPPPATGGVQ
jgi:hypothetical protein